MGAAGYKDGLKSRNVTHVLTVSNSLSPAHPNDFVYKVVAGMIDFSYIWSNFFLAFILKKETFVIPHFLEVVLFSFS